MTIALSTCGSHIGLEGLLIRNNDTLWISPERAHPFDSMLMDRAAKTEDEDYYSNNEFTNDKVENVTPSPHRIRLYDHFRLSYSKCATSEALSFTQAAEVETPHVPPYVERLSGHMQEHQLHMTVMLDIALIDNFFEGNLQMASSAVLSALNIADLISRRFGLHLIVSSFGIWDQEVPSPLSKFSPSSSRWNIHQMMTYNRWRYQNSTVEPFHPLLAVFSGVAFSKPKGIPLDATVPHSVCSKEAYRSVIFIAAEKGLPTPIVFDMASSFLHQIGHALGFAEDSCDSLSCSSAWCALATAENGDVRSLIAPLLNCPMRSDNLHSKQNLKCLLPSFKTTVQKSLLGVEQANAEWKLTDNTQDNHQYMNQKFANGNQGRCGDGYVDATEECDCEVKNGECLFDECCDPKLCLLHKWAQCSSSDLCCSKNCTLKPAETVCRPALSECDFPEQCTGLNGKCPANHLIADGFSCLDPSLLQPQVPSYGSSEEFSLGICFAGFCRSRDVACRALWGPSGKSAPAKCYEAMCNGCENMYCDQLQCQADDSSIALTNSTFVISQVHLEQNQVVNCRHFISQSSDRDIVKVGSVPDWSPCGSGKVCHGGHCVDMSSFNTANCPLGNSRVFVGENPNLAQNDIACSGNGWCVNSSSSTSMGKCICKPFWSGNACEVFINDTQIWPLFKNSTEPLLIYSSFFANFSNRALLTAVVPVVGCILIAFLFFVICYRRKLIVIKPKRKKRKRQQSFRRNSRNLSKTSLKGLPQLARTDTDDSRIASPVILCTTNSTFSVKNECGTEDHQEMEVVQTHPLLAKQPEKGILKKKMTSTDSNVSNDSTLQSTTNNSGICKVDPSQASLQMEAMMHNFKMNANFENGSVSEAFRNLAHHFNPTQQQQQQQQLNDWNGSSSQFDLINQRFAQAQPHQGSSENNSEGENGEMELAEGVMQLASLRQIVSMRRNSGAPSINDYHPPDHQLSNANHISSDSPHHHLGKNDPAVVKPDVISTCSPSRFMANVSSVAATINTSARPESCENRYI